MTRLKHKKCIIDLRTYVASEFVDLYGVCINEHTIRGGVDTKHPLQGFYGVDNATVECGQFIEQMQVQVVDG